MDKIEELLIRGVENIYPSKEALEKVLRSGKKLRLYQGFDPSMPNLHLGNYVGVLKLNQFQELGHEVIFLVGDFTGMIGDPTDKLATRKLLTRQQTRENSENYKEQSGRILKFEGLNPAKLKFNSEWNDKISFKDLIEICANFTFQQMIERDMFQKRLKENKPIHLHEFLYPVAQAIDCVKMDVDLELGGNDQTFNMLAGRTLMQALKGKKKFVMTTKLLVDARGNKVGKTTGNALFLDSSPENFYGGIMSFPDEVLSSGFELLTRVPMVEISAMDFKGQPMEFKKRLAFEVVKIIYGDQCAYQAQSQFEKVFQKGDVPTGKELIKVRSTLLADVLMEVGLVKSKSEAKRLIDQGAVDVNDKTTKDSHFQIEQNSEAIIKVGKTKFVRIRVDSP